MLRLLLLRHGQAARKEPQIADGDRALAESGRAAARLMGRFVRANGLMPQRLLVSPARRAQETAECFVSALQQEVPIETVEELYSIGDERALLDVVRRCGGEARSLMLVGHNPSIAGLAGVLARSGADMAAKVQRGFPTAALAVIEFGVETWSGLHPGTGEIVVFATPDSLDDRGASE